MAIGAGIGIANAPAGLGTLLFRMEVAGFEPIRVSMSRFAERVRDFRPFWREYFAPAFYREVERNFETEGGFVDGGWPWLSPDYEDWKDAHYPGKTMLRRTDALFHSLRFDGTDVGPQGIFIAEERALVLGTSVSYAGYLQRGTGRMPRRSFLFIGRQARSMWGTALHRFAVAAAADEGLHPADHAAISRARAVTSRFL